MEVDSEAAREKMGESSSRAAVASCSESELDVLLLLRAAVGVDIARASWRVGGQGAWTEGRGFAVVPAISSQPRRYFVHDWASAGKPFQSLALHSLAPGAVGIRTGPSAPRSPGVQRPRYARGWSRKLCCRWRAWLRVVRRSVSLSRCALRWTSRIVSAEQGVERLRSEHTLLDGL